MLDSRSAWLLLVSAASSEEEVGRAGGAERHGAAVPSSVGGRARRLEGGGGGTSDGGVAPEPAHLDRPVPAGWPPHARGPIPPSGLGSASVRTESRSPDL